MANEKYKALMELLGKGGDEFAATQKRDPLADLLKLEQFKAMQQERGEKKVGELSKRAEAIKLPETGSAIQQLSSSIQQHGPALGAISGAEAVPAGAVQMGEDVGNFLRKGGKLGEYAASLFPSPGATEQKQAFEALKAYERHGLYGSRLTEPERKMFLNSFGLTMSSDPQARLRGIQNLNEIHNKQVQNLRGGFPEETIKTYEERSGTSLSPREQMIKGPAQSPAEPAPTPASPMSPQAASTPMRVKHKASGKSGTIPASEFDPNTYEKIE